MIVVVRAVVCHSIEIKLRKKYQQWIGSSSRGFKLLNKWLEIRCLTLTYGKKKIVLRSSVPKKFSDGD
jgi:hypothetical protein